MKSTIDGNETQPQMTLDEQLTDAFDRGFRLGVDTLCEADRVLYRVQHFILDFEMGGLSAYLYNRLPDFEALSLTVAAMRRLGTARLADLLEEAANLLRGADFGAVATTWGEMLTTCDPSDRLTSIADQIASLPNYGLDAESVA